MHRILGNPLDLSTDLDETAIAVEEIIGVPKRIRSTVTAVKGRQADFDLPR
jgi:hypothetical protein